MPQDELFSPPDTGIRLTFSQMPTTDGIPRTHLEVQVRLSDQSWRLVDIINIEGTAHDYVGTIAEEAVNAYWWGSRRDLRLWFRATRRKLRKYVAQHPTEGNEVTRTDLHY